LCAYGAWSTSGTFSNFTDNFGRIYSLSQNTSYSSGHAGSTGAYLLNCTGGSTTITVGGAPDIYCYIVAREYTPADCWMFDRDASSGYVSLAGSNTYSSGNTPSTIQATETVVGWATSSALSSAGTGFGNFTNYTAGSLGMEYFCMEDMSVTSTGAQAATFGGTISTSYVCGAMTFRTKPAAGTTMTTPIMGASSAGPATSGTTYMGPGYQYSSVGWNASATVREILVSVPGTINGLFITQTTAPGTGASYTYYLYKNGAQQIVNCQISGTNKTATDSSNSFTVVKGDLISIGAVPSTSPAPASTGAVYYDINFIAANVSQMFAGTTGTLTSTGTNYGALQSNITSSPWATSNPNSVQAPVPTYGTFSAVSIYFYQNGPGTGKSWTLTLWKNGVATALAVTVSGSSQSGYFDGASVSVAPGDTVFWAITGTSSPLSSYFEVAVAWYPVTNGESILLVGQSNLTSASATQYCAPQGGLVPTWNATETSVQFCAMTFTTYNEYVVLGTAPGSTTPNYTINNRKTSANAGPTVNIAGAATTGNDTTHTGSFTAGNFIDFQCVPASSPATSTVGIGLVVFITPSGSGGGTNHNLSLLGIGT
jgi:hypothetical protein